MAEISSVLSSALNSLHNEDCYDDQNVNNADVCFINPLNTFSTNDDADTDESQLILNLDNKVLNDGSQIKKKKALPQIINDVTVMPENSTCDNETISNGVEMEDAKKLLNSKKNKKLEMNSENNLKRKYNRIKPAKKLKINTPKTILKTVASTSHSTNKNELPLQQIIPNIADNNVSEISCSSSSNIQNNPIKKYKAMEDAPLYKYLWKDNNLRDVIIDYEQKGMFTRNQRNRITRALLHLEINRQLNISESNDKTDFK